MSKQSLFFQEATHILSNSLNIGTVMGGLFCLLRKKIPLIRIGIGRGRFDLDAQEVLAICTSEGVVVTPPGELVPLTTAQISMRGALKSLWGCEHGVMVSSGNHPLARFFAQGGGNFSVVRPPFFVLRLWFTEDERPAPADRIGSDDRDCAPRAVGTMIFECDPAASFTADQLELLRCIRLPLRLALDNCYQHRALRRLKEDIREENERLRQQLNGLSSVQVIGGREGLAAIMERARLAAAVDVPVLITGETGTGKELIARALHELSPRREKNFVAVNCGGIPTSLIDSELFGHVKGAFTGAAYNHKGRFERAQSGTIFLDEIGELPLDVQARLLRVLQEMSIERVGGNAAVPVDFRLVAATHRDLTAMVQAGTFREDLFYRLNVVPIQVPPLRERVRDIPLLTEHLVRRGASRFGISPPPIAPGEMAALLAYHWPGNVRELQNTIEEALVLFPKGPLRFRGLRTTGTSTPQMDPAPVQSWEAMQHRYFQSLLHAASGRINGEKGAAALAGLNPSTFRFKLTKLGIPFGKQHL